MFEFHDKIINQEIDLPLLKQNQVRLFIKREDQLHNKISGNKYRKLKYNILEAKKLKAQTILTFGGAYSNHIVATAAAAKKYNLNAIGIIRGEELGNKIEHVLKNNKSLKFAYEQGMKFKFISREDYKTKTNSFFLEKLRNEFRDFYLIPEGGTNSLAVKGCEEILSNEDKKFDYICSSVGTGGTIAGLINTIDKHQRVIGFPALKENFLENEIKKYSKNNTSWYLKKEYHFGGYGKFNKNLIDFINDFKKNTLIPLDPIYTGKMLYGIIDMVAKGEFIKGTTILVIHTGGLQGIEGANEKLKKKGSELIE
ncbi:MAG TPA: 1-aminocyclopropane-1-carboxylate deaminase [Tenacibaculum sp.]|nr:1-aminocyclopropane-1-carboxylate deaminase [Tenacibaculum sp.]